MGNTSGYRACIIGEPVRGNINNFCYERCDTRISGTGI